MKTLRIGALQSTCDWVSERTGGRMLLDAATWTIGLVEDGALIAGVVFEGWNGASMNMHVAAQPGKRWMTRGYLYEVFRYPFDFAGARKVIGLVGSQNLVAQRFDEHLGFVREATLDEAHPDGALLVYTMTRAQCRWLNRGQNGKERTSAAGLCRASSSPRPGEPEHSSV